MPSEREPEYTQPCAVDHIFKIITINAGARSPCAASTKVISEYPVAIAPTAPSIIIRGLAIIIARNIIIKVCFLFFANLNTSGVNETAPHTKEPIESETNVLKDAGFSGWIANRPVSPPVLLTLSTIEIIPNISTSGTAISLSFDIHFIPKSAVAVVIFLYAYCPY